MPDQPAQEERTEAATPRRFARAREEGNVALSRELPVLAGLLAATLVLAAAGDTIAHGLAARLAGFLAHADGPQLAGSNGLRHAAQAMLAAVAPVLLAVLLAGTLAVLLQTGLLVRGQALRPFLHRISAGAGVRRLLSAESAIDSLKSLIKVSVLAAVTWQVLRTDLPALQRAPRWDIPALLDATTHEVLRMLAAVLLIQTLVAAADLLWARLRYARQLRMTRQELRDEQKETEGDPKIKARIRQIRHQRARRRMLAAVPRATVVVTNPTHYAVALAYDRTKHAAPRVVAKGADELAARIREVAQANRVPLVGNPPLARALYRVELDTEIPTEHFQAVAEIIAYVWRLGSRQERQAPA